jgi:ubiquitin carboxyl-terminal hydrolase 5/13
MLKTLIGKGHAEFAGVKQQDAQEFLIWLLSRIQREGKPTGKVEQNLIQAEKNEMNDEGSGGYVDPTKVFKFGVQQRIQCLGCGYVKYRVDEQDNFNIPVPDRLKRYAQSLIESIDNSPATPAAALVDAPKDDAPIDPAPQTSETAPPEYQPVDFEDCVKTFTAKQVIELSCSNCHHTRAILENGFITLPDVLIITASRFVLKNWVPTKLDIPLVVPEFPIPFTTVPRGLQPGERPLPEVIPALPPLHAQSYVQLQEMGFPANRAEKALRETGNNDVDVAMQWLFQHMEDPEIDLPYNRSTPSAVDPEKVTNLVGMGFDEPTVKKALQETVQ